MTRVAIIVDTMNNPNNNFNNNNNNNNNKVLDFNIIILEKRLTNIHLQPILDNHQNQLSYSP
jgi:hypothetical protein